MRSSVPLLFDAFVVGCPFLSPLSLARHSIHPPSSQLSLPTLWNLIPITRGPPRKEKAIPFRNPKHLSLRNIYIYFFLNGILSSSLLPPHPFVPVSGSIEFEKFFTSRMDEVDPSSGESLPRAFETNFFLETGRLVSNTVSQFLSLLFHVHLFSRGYFPLLFFSLSFFLLLDFFKRYVISFFSYVLLFHVLLSIIFVIRNVISFFFFFFVR